MAAELNTQCYRFEKKEYADPIFKDIEATYIIHLEGNGRLPAIHQQLSKYHPTKTVYILFNKGFKKCKKSENIDKSPVDLVDAFFTCFKDANNKGYENILILEDDFIFDEKIAEPCHVNSIESFLNEKKGENFVYYLGSIPLMQFSTFSDHNRLIFSGGTHSVIYTKPFIQYILTVPQESIVDYDLFLNKIVMNTSRYTYDSILCYQLFPKTENQANWGNNIFEKTIIVPVFLFIISYLKLDTQLHPGYNIFNIMSKIICWIVILTQLLLFLMVNYFIWRNFNWLKKNWNYYIYIFFGTNILYPIIILSLFLLMLFIGRIYHIGVS